MYYCFRGDHESSDFRKLAAKEKNFLNYYYFHVNHAKFVSPMKMEDFGCKKNTT